MNARILFVVASCLVAASASAQLPGIGGIRVKAGYGWSGKLTDTNGDRRSLNGPLLGVEMPLSRLPLVELGLSGEVLLGGQLSRGSDLDGYLYRFFLNGRAQIPGSKFSVFGGVGFGTAQARGGQFASFSGFVSQWGVGIPISSAPMIAPTFDLAVNLADKSGLSGFSATVGIRF